MDWVFKPVTNRVPASVRSAVAATKPEGGPLPQEDGSLICGDVRLIPAAIRMSTSGEGEAARHLHDPFSSAGVLAPDAFISVWQGLDVTYNRNGVYLIDAERSAHKVLEHPRGSIQSVCFDGRYLWVSSVHDNSLYVFDSNGSMVEQITADDGIPIPSVKILIAPLAPGRVMLAGALGGQRGWLATAQLAPTNDAHHVTVFHEAVKTFSNHLSRPMQDNQEGGHLADLVPDTHIKFDPDWMFSYEDPNGGNWVIVNRRQWPLVINAETRHVAVCGMATEEGRFSPYASSFPRMSPPGEAFLTYAGKLYVAGTSSDFGIYVMDPQTLGFSPTGERQPSHRWHDGGFVTHGSLTRQGSILYYAGEQHWLRYDLKTGSETELIGNPRDLPGYGSSQNWML